MANPIIFPETQIELVAILRRAFPIAKALRAQNAITSIEQMLPDAEGPALDMANVAAWLREDTYGWPEISDIENAKREGKWIVKGGTFSIDAARKAAPDMVLNTRLGAMIASDADVAAITAGVSADLLAKIVIA